MNNRRIIRQPRFVLITELLLFAAGNPLASPNPKT